MIHQIICPCCGSSVAKESKFNIGESVGWCAPYGYERVTIEDVRCSKDKFEYKTKQYNFWFYEYELESIAMPKNNQKSTKEFTK